jgi:putative transposase
MSEIYHILNRGTDKRKIFLSEQDYFRFIHDLFEFNDQNILKTTSFNFQMRVKTFDVERRNISFIEKRKRPRKLLVDIHAFCLMPNHYHLLLSSKIENGISKFMHKLGTGYVKYFNIKHERKGTLFEGRYKSILVEKEPHFYHLPYYIHFNPLDLKFKEWRQGKLKNYKQAMRYLNNYRWSSHLDYLGKKNFPSITNRKFLTQVFGGQKKYQQSIKQWLRDLELERIRELVLE